MRIAVLRETADRERRVALTPDAAKRLVAAGHEVVVESGAGESAFFADGLYVAAGATTASDAASAARGAHLVVRVQRPRADEISHLERGVAMVALLQPPLGVAWGEEPSIAGLAAGGVTAFALERVPRISRAQSMDVLSSQATIAGYKGVLMGATHLARLMPMLTTAAGSIPPAKVLVIGAGVAGLQAIATARRLGARVSAFDVRPAAREQVQSLGAVFVARELVTAGAEGAGGYAREQTPEERTAIAEALAAHAADMDMIICTAAVPGRRAPMILTAASVEAMRPGSVVVDLAAETGGNCELTRPGETLEVGGITILGPLNVPSTLPSDASKMLSFNVMTFAQHLNHDGELRIDLEDPITKAMLVTHNGQVID